MQTQPQLPAATNRSELFIGALTPDAQAHRQRCKTQLSHYRAFGDMRLAEFRGNTARLSICGAKPVRTER